MFQLIHNLTAGELFKRQLPVFATAFVIAEFLYKFHSFTLECIAFLVTWYVLDAVAQRMFWTAEPAAKNSQD